FWPHKAPNAAIYCAPVSSISAGQRRNGQVADRRDTVYGSDALGPHSDGDDHQGRQPRQGMAGADPRPPGWGVRARPPSGGGGGGGGLWRARRRRRASVPAPVGGWWPAVTVTFAPCWPISAGGPSNRAYNSCAEQDS